MTRPPAASRGACHRPFSSLARGLVAVSVVWALVGCAAMDLLPDLNAPTLPASEFAWFDDRDPDITSTVRSLAADGDTVVAVVGVEGPVSYPQFWRSDDAGATWTLGTLSWSGARETTLDEGIVGHATVTGSGDDRVWIVLGETRDEFLVWHSEDATTWDRTVAGGIDPATSSINEIQAVPSGFVAVGAALDPETDKWRGAVWRSGDGLHWEERFVGGADTILLDVAHHADAWVVVGLEQRETRSDDDRVSSPSIYLSKDAGETWDAQQVEEPDDSDNFTTFIESVVANDEGFTAVGSYYRGEPEWSYEPWSLTSTDGESWSTQGPLPRSNARSFALDVLVSDSQTLLVRSLERATSTSLWLEVEEESVWNTWNQPTVEGTVDFHDAVLAGQSVLISVSATDQVTIPALWRAETIRGEWTSFTFPAPQEMTPRIDPSEVLLDDGGYSVWGNAQGVVARWDQTDDGSWGEPQVVTDAARTWLWGVEKSPESTLVWGSQEGEAMVLTSPDGEEWVTSGPGTFGEVEKYHDSSIRDAVWAGDRWVVVGNKTTNASVRRSGLVYSSTDGTTWIEGRGAQTLATGDRYSAEDVATDLAGLEDMSRYLTAVTTVPDGLIATGYTNDGERDQAAVWRSRDAETWTLATLPSEDLKFTQAVSVASRDADVVVAGFGTVGGGEDWEPRLWTSHDGGQTFTMTPLGDQGPVGGIYLASSQAHGFVVVATPRGEVVPTLWRSDDGSAWASEQIDAPGAVEGTESVPRDILIDGDTLVVLMKVRNRLEASTIVVEVPLG